MILEHDSWISLEPIEGCPYFCDYCFLGSTDQRNVRPASSVTPRQALAALQEYLGSRVDKTPIAVGNHTDIAAKSNRAFLRDLIVAFSETDIRRPLVVITKSPDIGPLLDGLTGRLDKVIFILSQSFAKSQADSIERPGTCTDEQTYENFMACRSAGVPAIHFWRPFIRSFNPVSDLPTRVSALADAGCSGSIVVGLKTHSGTAERWSPGTSNVLTQEDLLLPGDERFDGTGWSILTGIAREIGYPLWRNTSCALSTIQGTADFLSTMFSDWSGHYCRSTTCPESQRRRCAQRPGLPVTSGVADELDLVRASHTTGRRVTSVRQIGRSKEWVGVASTGAREDVTRLTLAAGAPTEAVYAALARLEKVTGFASVLPSDENRRSRAFNRLAHVQRVHAVSLMAREGLARGGDRRIDEVVVFHDLARLPFAHNLEKRLQYDQAAASCALVERLVPDCEPRLLDDLRAFHGKDWLRLSLPGRVALASDQLAGAIEDVLMFVVALGAQRDRVPEALALRIGLDLFDPVLEERVNAARTYFHIEQNVEAFNSVIGSLVLNAARTFFSRRGSSDLEERCLRCVRAAKGVRQEFAAPAIFPWNNEIVSHAAMIGELGSQFLRRFPTEWQSVHAIGDSVLLERVLASGFTTRSVEDFRFDFQSLVSVGGAGPFA